MNLSQTLHKLTDLARRGTDHSDHLSEIDSTIVISGTRGKSGLTRRLCEALSSRDNDVLGKITGNHPKMIHNDEERPIERDGRVTLYENEAEIGKYDPGDALVVENQAIGEYTTRLINQRFTDPDVVVLTNVRRDHIDRLGANRMEIARSFARAVPEGTHVVNGEQTEEIQTFFEETFADRDVTLTHVEVPEGHETIPGAETVHAVDHVLDAVDEPRLTDAQLQTYLDEMRVDWTRLAGGRVFNAASVNDVDSTEMIRRALCRQRGDVVQPFLYLRGDRRARTTSFLNYLTELYQEGAIEQVRVAGETTELFADRAPFPVIVHDEEPADTLDAALGDGWPVLVMGNTVAEYMRELEADIERREEEVAPPAELDELVVASDADPDEIVAEQRTEAGHTAIQSDD